MLKKIFAFLFIVSFTSFLLVDTVVKGQEQPQPPTDTLPGLKIGTKAPDFELKDLTGQTVKLSDYRGKKVVLNFWATWCPPCKAEMPDMEKFYQETLKETVVLAVNIDPQYDVKSFAKDLGITLPILLDEKDQVNRTYQILTIPTTYFIDPNGVIRNKYLSAMSIDKMRELVDQM